MKHRKAWKTMTGVCEHAGSEPLWGVYHGYYGGGAGSS